MKPDVEQLQKALLNDKHFIDLMRRKAKVYETSPVKYIIDGEGLKAIYPERTVKLIENIDIEIEHIKNQLNQSS